MQLPYADEVPYFKTGTTTPDTWLEKAANEIKKREGAVVMRALANDIARGQGEAYLFVFMLEGEMFRVMWPVLPVRNDKDELAARRQACTMIFHDVKARCVSADVLGARTAFLSYLLLPGGQTAADISSPELAADLTKLLTPGG